MLFAMAEVDVEAKTFQPNHEGNKSDVDVEANNVEENNEWKKSITDVDAATEITELKDRKKSNGEITVEHGEVEPGVKINHDDAADHSADKAARSSCCHCCKALCKPCMTKHNPLPSGATRSQQLHYAFMCPIHGHLARIAVLVVLAGLMWGALWSVTGDTALPGGNLFGLSVLFVCCALAGVIAEKIRFPRFHFHLPPLLGMLLMGFALRNIPKINVAADIDHGWSGALRALALTVILTRAGLGLDPVALRKLSLGVLRLAFSPCIVESITAAIASHFILGFPWEWGFMLGFVLAAVSPAVVVPCILSLHARGYGVEKGIPTLIIAASSIDDVIAITGFGVVLGISFSTGHIGWTIVKGPLEAIIGIIYGIIFGVILWYLPHSRHENKIMYRFILLMSAGIFAVFASRTIEFSGAGPLGVLTVAFVAGLRWRKELRKGQEMKVAVYVGHLWTVFEPLLFGLIGAEVSLTLIEPATIGLGLVVLCIGLILRIITSYIVVIRLGLTIREKLFVALAWLPKATVQAAIGSLALDTARHTEAGDEQITRGIQLLTVAVLAIVVTAPVGAIAISVSGPLLLKRSRGRASVTADVELPGH